MIPKRRWQPTEDLLVCDLSRAGFLVADMAALLHRSYESVRARRTSLDLASRRGGAPPWSDREDALVAELSQFVPDRVLGDLLGRTVRAVRGRRSVFLGLPRFTPAAWTAAELVTLKVAYQVMPRATLAALLPRHPIESIANKARELGIKKSTQHIALHPIPACPLPPEAEEVRLLTKLLRKKVANEERRRSASAAVCRAGSAEREARAGRP